MIEVRNISKTYPDGTVALSDVDLAFGDGMLGLLGPNGAGKTTLLSILVLAQEPSRGDRVYFDLDDRSRHRPRIRSMLGYLPQEFYPTPLLSGLEYLRMCAELRQVPLGRRALLRRIEALLEAVELTHAAHQRAVDYSGGMVRRLGLAQALVHFPRFLVVDEPTAGLDPEERIRFRNLITDLAEEIPVLLSTHIVEDIEATCPRLVILDHGRLLFDGEPSEVLRRCEGCLWSWPDDTPLPEGAHKVARRALEGGAPQTIVYAPRTPEAVGIAVTAVEPTLEEAAAVFLHVTTDELAETDEKGGRP